MVHIKFLLLVTLSLAGLALARVERFNEVDRHLLELLKRLEDRQIKESAPDSITEEISSRGTTAPAIGIDLGTSYCRVGVFRNGEVEIIPNEQGNRNTPSYVAFTDTQRLIGDAAKKQAAMNPSNTVYGKAEWKEIGGKMEPQVKRKTYDILKTAPWF